MNAMTIKIGDEVNYSILGHYGTAKVESIELCNDEWQAYGEAVEEVSGDDIKRAVFDLDNGKWVYGNQIIL